MSSQYDTHKRHCKKCQSGDPCSVALDIIRAAGGAVGATVNLAESVVSAPFKVIGSLFDWD